MKLTDLNPSWTSEGGPGITRDGQPVPERRGVGIIIDCPCGNRDEDHRLFIPFAVALDGSPGSYGEKGWQRTGDTFETLTLRPSVLRVGGCKWHGFITNGEAVSC